MSNSVKNLDASVIEEFATQIRGKLILPQDSNYDETRKVYNAMIDKRPGMFVKCVDVADVIAAVNFGRENNLLIAVRGGGHNGGGLGLCDEGLVIDLSGLKYVRVDTNENTVRVGGGNVWGEVDHATHPFGLAVPAGIMQADIGLNRILHNTQWIIGPHVHVAILIGLTMTLYSAIYLLFPIVTNGAKLYSQKLANFHFWAHLIGGIGMGAFMGMAGLEGMLRRTIYLNGEFDLYMILAGISGSLLLFAFLAFFYNIVMSLGLFGVIGIFTPSKLDEKLLVPEEK